MGTLPLKLKTNHLVFYLFTDFTKTKSWTSRDLQKTAAVFRGTRPRLSPSLPARLGGQSLVRPKPQSVDGRRVGAVEPQGTVRTSTRALQSVFRDVWRKNGIYIYYYTCYYIHKRCELFDAAECFFQQGEQMNSLCSLMVITCHNTNQDSSLDSYPSAGGSKSPSYTGYTWWLEL